jgi:hypothetical protein
MSAAECQHRCCHSSEKSGSAAANGFALPDHEILAEFRRAINYVSADLD